MNWERSSSIHIMEFLLECGRVIIGKITKKDL